MAISWYPGHMNKARKELEKVFRGTDAVIEVLDARMPIASSNPLLGSMIEQLPTIKILNKTDLADPNTTQAWFDYFNALEGCTCLLNGRDRPLQTSSLLQSANKLISKSDNAVRTRHMVVIGIPNVGKSSLLNQITDRKVAKTGNEPAVTKGQQRVKLDDTWYIIDTPGMMWPKLEDQEAAYRLACTGTIRNTAVEAEDIAWFTAELLLANYRGAVKKRYDIPDSVTKPEQLLQHIAKLRGSIGRGGQPDWNKTSVLLLNDFRSGKLGTFSLETPPV